MIGLPSRILYAVPRTLEKRLEITRAIQTLAASDDRQQAETSVAAANLRAEHDLIAEIVQDALQILRKAGFNPNEPRVPAGNPDGGHWTKGSSSGGVGAKERPSDQPPEIPSQELLNAKARNAFLKAAARWLLRAGLEATLGGPAGDYMLALEAVYWLSKYLPYIIAYLQPPKKWDDLQKDALNPQTGYDIHHPVEQTSAAQDGFPADQINSPENRLRIPTLKHWLITGWYQAKNPDYGDLSPRNYLRGKSWDERVHVARDAMIRFGVLKP